MTPHVILLSQKHHLMERERLNQDESNYVGQQNINR